MSYAAKKIIMILSAIVLVVLVSLSMSKFHNTTCSSVDICIKDSSQVYFVDHNEVLEIIYAAVPDIVGYRMDSIDTYLIERKLRENPYIRKVSIYKRISGVLNIDLEQRIPTLMVMSSDNQSFYMDNDGYIFATNPNYYAKTIVVSGYIKDKYDFSNGKIYKVDLSSENHTLVGDLFRLSKLIQSDDFWRDQVEQIYVNKQGEYELVPMLGSQILVLGSIEDYDKKMYILKQFYFKAMPKVGWNTYKQISVKYKDQIVCKRK